MTKRAKTVSINLRLPADLHKRLVEAAASSSPANSLNSEILSRLFDSFEMPGMFKTKLSEIAADVKVQMKEVEVQADNQMKEVQVQADKMAQRMENTLAEYQKLKRRVEDKLK